MIQTKQIKLTELHLNNGQIAGVPKNPRFIKDDRFEKLKQSLQDDPEFLEARPIVVYDNGDGMLIVVGGNMRLRALREIGVKSAPVFVLPKDTKPEKLRAFIIKDNIGYGEDDYDALLAEWDVEELQLWGIENIKTNIKDEKEIKENPPSIVSSFITFDYADDVDVLITEETAQALMAEMIEYAEKHDGSYNGFWDERLKK